MRFARHTFVRRRNPMEREFTSSSASIQPSFLSRLFSSLQQQWQAQLDRSVPFIKTRWVLFVLFTCLYFIRVHFLQGFYIITYGFGIYLLHLFIGFLAPKDDPDADGPLLPNYDRDEYKPFVRRLPEFKCWYSATKSLGISFSLTLSNFFDFPVFWPILVVYFFILFFMTMKRQIGHMIKWKYVPFSFGKPKFGSEQKVPDATVSRDKAVGGPVGNIPRVAPSQPKATADDAPPTRVAAGFTGNVARSSIRSYTNSVKRNYSNAAKLK
uniref:Protein RER1 n=1 Tax=Hirondellea gigas TaxID=1518452 RepID=A0A6A7GBC3_9CRUS